MAGALRQEVFADDSFGSGTTIQSPALTLPALAHSSFVVWVTCSATNVVPTVTDNSGLGQVYTNKLPNAFDSGAGNQALLGFIMQANQATTAFRVSATYGSAQTGKGIWVQEISGVLDASYDNNTAQIIVFPGTGINAVTSGLITPVTQPAFAVGLTMEILNGNGTGLAAGTGFTIGSSGWAFGGPTILAKSQSRQVVLTSSMASTMTDTANGNSSEYAAAIMLLDVGSIPIIPPTTYTLEQGEYF